MLSYLLRQLFCALAYCGKNAGCTQGYFLHLPPLAASIPIQFLRLHLLLPNYICHYSNMGVLQGRRLQENIHSKLGGGRVLAYCSFLPPLPVLQRLNLLLLFTCQKILLRILSGFLTAPVLPNQEERLSFQMYPDLPITFWSTRNRGTCLSGPILLKRDELTINDRLD